MKSPFGVRTPNAELQAELRARRLPTDGSKPALLARLHTALATSAVPGRGGVGAAAHCGHRSAERAAGRAGSRRCVCLLGRSCCSGAWVGGGAGRVRRERRRSGARRGFATHHLSTLVRAACSGPLPAAAQGRGRADVCACPTCAGGSWSARDLRLRGSEALLGISPSAIAGALRVLPSRGDLDWELRSTECSFVFHDARASWLRLLRQASGGHTLGCRVCALLDRGKLGVQAKRGFAGQAYRVAVGKSAVYFYGETLRTHAASKTHRQALELAAGLAADGLPTAEADFADVAVAAGPAAAPQGRAEMGEADGGLEEPPERATRRSDARERFENHFLAVYATVHGGHPCSVCRPYAMHRARRVERLNGDAGDSGPRLGKGCACVRARKGDLAPWAGQV
jgi:hypothetical protein